MGEYKTPELSTPSKLSDKDYPATPRILDKVDSPTSQILAEVINIDDNQDGQPVAIKLPYHNRAITILSVTDGLGGSGNRRQISNTSGETFTDAFLGARSAQAAVADVCSSISQSNESISLSHLQNILEKKLDTRFSNLKNLFNESKETAENMYGGQKPFPTTLSAIFIAEKSTETEGLILKAGDSPVFIFTQDKVYTTEQTGDGDAPMKSNICQGSSKLEPFHFFADNQTPFLVVIASDGLIKITDENIPHLQSIFKKYLLQSETLSDAMNKLKSQYSKITMQPDDTTISLATFGMTQPIKEWAKSWSDNPSVIQISRTTDIY